MRLTDYRDRTEEDNLVDSLDSSNRSTDDRDRIKPPTPTTETPSPTSISNSDAQPSSNGLEAKLDRLVDVITKFVELQISRGASSNSSPIQSGATNSNIASVVKSHSVAELKQEDKPKSKYKTGADEAIINRAIDAIIAHNNGMKLHDLKWAITINTLKAFSKNQRAIEKIIGKGRDNPNITRVIGTREDEIEQHHSQHHLQTGHNNRHKRKRTLQTTL